MDVQDNTSYVISKHDNEVLGRKDKKKDLKERFSLRSFLYYPIRNLLSLDVSVVYVPLVNNQRTS